MKKKYIRRIVILLLAGIIMFGFYYVNDYYHALETDIEAYQTEKIVNVEVSEDDTIVCIPEKATAGMIFYPGGKVEYTAYLPLMKACASNGILCVLVEMPFNLAVLDINAADGIQQKYSEISNWYMAGHSLGGSMAASYIGGNADEYDGLILLGSYSTEDLKDTELKVLSIYGSEDKVMKRDNYIENIENMPTNFEEEILQGGNHAGFGMYGAQEGDGKATLSNEEQILMTADIIRKFIFEEEGLQ